MLANAGIHGFNDIMGTGIRQHDREKLKSQQ